MKRGMKRGYEAGFKG